MRGSSPLLGDLLGVSRSVERDTLFVLLVYPRNFLSVLFVSFLIRDISLCEYPYYVFICVRLFWFSCQYLLSEWLESLL